MCFLALLFDTVQEIILWSIRNKNNIRDTQSGMEIELYSSWNYSYEIQRIH